MIPTKPILLVEDQAADVQLIELILARHGCADQLAAVNDGVLALDYLYRRGAFAERALEQPVLVLLDLKMPRLDGFEVLRQVKGDAALQAIPLVVLTSSAQPQDVERAYALGANSYLVKHVDFQAFGKLLITTYRFWLEYNEPPPLCMRPARTQMERTAM